MVGRSGFALRFPFFAFQHSDGLGQASARSAEDGGEIAVCGNSNEEALVVVGDLGFHQGVEIARDASPLGLDAGNLHAAVQLALQQQGEEGTEDVATDGLVALVIDGPRHEDGLVRTECLFEHPNNLPSKS